MSLISDPTASDHETIEPGTHFQKVWHIKNSGTEVWPSNCYLQCAQGANMECTRQDVPVLGPDCNMYITVDLISPPSPGIYQSKWRLCTASGTYFGGDITKTQTQFLIRVVFRSAMGDNDGCGS